MLIVGGVRAPSYHIYWRQVGDWIESGAWRLCMDILANFWKHKKSGVSMPNGSNYFAVNGVTDAENATSKPGECETYDELVVALTEHHSPAPSEIVQRFKFNSRFRYAGESVATYVAELRSIAQTCNYGSWLDEMLRDHIVCGISDDHIQQRLLSKKGLTYKKALKSLQGLETAAKNVRRLQSAKQEPAQVHKVTPDGRGGVQTAGVGRGCFRCGNTAHSSSHCPFKGARCHNMWQGGAH